MNRIAVATAGAADEDAVSAAEVAMRETFGLPTWRIDDLPDPSHAFDPVRRQFSSTLLLRDALAKRPADARKIVVFTEPDIFIPMLSFVFGQAQLDGPAAVVSFARLRQEFYGLPPQRELFLERVVKETLHEVGHTFGLTHCRDPRCTMTLSTSIHQIDTKEPGFCGDCSQLLLDSLGTDAAGRTYGEEALGNPRR